MPSTHPIHEMPPTLHDIPVPPPPATKGKGRHHILWPLAPASRPVEKPEPQRAEILNVLSRAASDPAFIAKLTYAPAEALEGYELSPQARAAIVSGDLRWIEARTGKLDARLRTWIDCRLQQEIW